MKVEGIAKILEGFIFGLSLTRHIYFDALSHEPLVLLPNAGGEFLFHLIIHRGYWKPKASGPQSY